MLQTTSKKKIAGYIRVSTEDQAINGCSLEAQENAIVRHANSMGDGYTLDTKNHIYIDAGKTGSNGDREAFQRLICDAEKGLFDVILVWRIDRFFRSTLGLLTYVERLNNCGVGLRSVVEEAIDITNNEGMLMLSIVGAIGENERAAIRQRTTLGRIHKSKMGFYVGGGAVKFGYRKLPTTGGNILEVNETEADIVRRIFSLYVEDGKTLGEIAKLFTIEGILTKYDTDMSKKTDYRVNRTKGHWYASYISSIIKDTRYIGEYYYGRKKAKKDKKSGKMIVSQRDINDPLVVKLECPKILDNPEIFYRAQELLKKNQITKSNKDTYIFTGLIVCESCGRKYVGYKSTKNTISYRCGASCGNKLPMDKRCHNAQVSEDILLEGVWGKMKDLFYNPDKILEKYYEKSKMKDSKIPQLHTKMNETDNAIKINKNALSRAYQDMYTDTNEFIREAKQNAINSIQLKLESLQSVKAELDIKYEQVERAEEAKKNIRAITKKVQENIKGISTDKKRIELIQKFVDRIVIDKKKVCLSFKFAYNSPRENDKGTKGKTDKNSVGNDDNSGRGPLNNDVIPYEHRSYVPLDKPLLGEVKTSSGISNMSRKSKKSPS